MRNSKIILSVFLTITMLSSTGVVFADNKISNSEDVPLEVPTSKKETVSDSFNIEDYMGAAVQNSEVIRAQEKALKMAQISKSRSFDALADIPYNISKKDPYEYLKVTELDMMDADLDVFSAENNLDMADTTVRIGLYEQYVGLIKLMDSIELQKKIIENKENSFLKVKQEYALGKISKVKFEEEERNIKKLKLQFDNLNLNKISMLMSINNVTGQPILKEYSRYIRPDVDKKVVDVSFEEYLEQALINRMEILFGEKKLEVKKLQYEKVNNLFPSKKNEHNMDYKSCIDEAQLNLDKAKLDIEMEARETISTLENKKSQLKNLERDLENANFNYKMAKGKFNMGLITKDQIENLKLSCEQIESSISGIKLDLWIYRLKMNYASGLGPGIR